MSSEDSIVIVGMARTPMGGLMGELAGLSANELGAEAVKAALAEAEDDLRSGRYERPNASCSPCNPCLFLLPRSFIFSFFFLQYSLNIAKLKIVKFCQLFGHEKFFL